MGGVSDGGIETVGATVFLLQEKHTQIKKIRISRIIMLRIRKMISLLLILQINSTYNGIFPCFFRGLLSTLFSSMANALISFRLVSLGSITSSTKPLSAAR